MQISPNIASAPDGVMMAQGELIAHPPYAAKRILIETTPGL
jgi:hypothetical protein